MSLKIPQFPKKFKGSFWGITAFFNPVGYRNKYKNYKIFQENLKRQGLKLLTVELSFNNKFEIQDNDADIVIRLKGTKRNMMWQKERMLNIGLKYLPKDCDKICWLDADIIFKNDNWVEETSKLLNKYNIVQPFASIIRLRRGVHNLTSKKIASLKRTIAERENVLITSMAKKAADSSRLNLRNQVFYHGHSGFAWAARRKLFKNIGFFDKNLAGAGDLQMAFAFYFKDLKPIENLKTQKVIDPIPSILKDYYLWNKKMYSRVKGSVFYTPGVILHLWHGALDKRGFNWRFIILERDNFNLKKDIIIDKNGLYAWVKSRKRFYRDFEYYFYFRDEEKMDLQSLLISRGIWAPLNMYKRLKANLVFFNRRRILDDIDRKIGQTGIFIKSISPKVYFKLKKVKNILGMS